MDKTLPMDSVTFNNLLLQSLNTIALLFIIIFMVVAFIAIIKYIKKN